MITISDLSLNFSGEPLFKDVNLKFTQGNCYGVIGANGAGKSTFLRILSGDLDPSTGTVSIAPKTRMSVLKQDHFAFNEETVLNTVLGGNERLLEVMHEKDALYMKDPFTEEDGNRAAELESEFAEMGGWDAETEASQLLNGLGLDADAILYTEMKNLGDVEKVKVLLARALFGKPDILLLDEPTKGLDAAFKQSFAAILSALTAAGTTVVMVSHDVAFCARYAHRCALFFDGSIVAEGTPRDFFSGNSFYTTSANRMARDFCPCAVTPEDVIAVIGGTVPPQPEVPAAWQPLPPVAEESTAWKSKKLPWWRRTIAAVCGAGALAIFWLAAKHTDLTALVGGGTLSQAGWQALGLYGLFIALLFGCIAAIGRRSKPLTLLQTPVQKRKLSHRTRLAAALILLCIPATLYLGFFYLGNTAYYPIAFAVLLECMVPFFLVFEGRKPQARELVLVASLCALGVAGRAAFFMLPQFKPVLALTIISGVALGGETGFLVGAMTMLASNVLFSQGPWTPFQMFAMGIIGFLAGVLFRRGWLRRSRAALCVFGAISAVLIYGGIMNPVSALLYARTLEWKVIAAYYVTGFPMDCVHAAATVFFLLVLAEPMLEKLDRIKIKYGLVE